MARRSGEFVKSNLPSRMASPAPVLADNSPIKNQRLIPEELEKGSLMTKITDGKQKKVEFKLDGDEGKLYYTSSRDGLKTGTSSFNTTLEIQSLIRDNSADRMYKGASNWLANFLLSATIQAARVPGGPLDNYHIYCRGQIQDTPHHYSRFSQISSMGRCIEEVDDSSPGTNERSRQC